MGNEKLKGGQRKIQKHKESQGTIQGKTTNTEACKKNNEIKGK